MSETVEKVHVLVAEQEQIIKALMAKDQVSSDELNRISFHLGFLYGVSGALRRVDVVGMTVSDKEQIIASVKYAAESIKKEAADSVCRHGIGAAASLSH